MTTRTALNERYTVVHKAILAGPHREDQELIDSGEAWQREGQVGRRCMAALQSGAAVLPEDRYEDYYGTVVPSYTDVKDEVGSTGSVANAEAYKEE